MTLRPIVLLGLPGPATVVLAGQLAAALGRPVVDRISATPTAVRPTAADPSQTDMAGPVVALSQHDGGPGLEPFLDGDPVVVWIDDTTVPAVAGQPSVWPAVAADVVVPVNSADGTDGIEGTGELVARLVAAVGSAPSRHRRLTGHVELGPSRRYPVVVGRGARHDLSGLLPAGVKRVAVVTQAGIGVSVDPGVEHQVFVVEDGEQAKRLEVVGDLASRFARWGLTRRDAVVSVGGGVVSDLAGFVAASYHRGIAVIHVPTTLLGQIDAAIGGKCGVNLPEGKNLLGAFKQPAAVVCDIDTLGTLPPAELACGMGELAKYHFLGGGDLDRLPLPERVARCAAIKAEVVAGDETEGGRRAILNYGHTLAHALEIATDYELRHGEAVAIGLLYAAELAHALGRIDADRVTEHRRVIGAYGLHSAVPAGLDPDELIALFARDKKAIDGITFVLDGPDGIEPVVVDDRDLLRATLDTVAGPQTPTRETVAPATRETVAPA